jgi:hypothetical protein
VLGAFSLPSQGREVKSIPLSMQICNATEGSSVTNPSLKNESQFKSPFSEFENTGKFTYHNQEHPLASRGFPAELCGLAW